MNAELPPFKNGEHNSERASTIDPVFWPFELKNTMLRKTRITLLLVFSIQGSTSHDGFKTTFSPIGWTTPNIDWY